jgi:tryptophanyl-tRNA synthetase
VDKNREAGEDDDAGVSAGLFMYPVLMAADILLFNANQVPVGRDQIQHIEMARDFGQRFNHLYGDHFVMPEAVIDENVATLPGLDGRKMSKSYDNTIPLFAPRETLKKLIYSIVTDSRAPGEAKDADNSNVFQLYQAFASNEETAAMRRAFADGIAWGEAKQALFERIDREISPLREKYDALIAQPAHIEAILRDGAQRLRTRYARPTLDTLRSAVGLRDLSQAQVDGKAKITKATAPAFKQYREADGRFYFKFVDGDRLLAQSRAFDSARDAGTLIAGLKSGASGVDALFEASTSADGVTQDDVREALAAVVEAEQEKSAQKA